MREGGWVADEQGGRLGEVDWHGSTVRCYPGGPPTIVHNLAQGRQAFGGRLLLEAPEGSVSYGEFAELVEGAADRLTELGLGPGDRLAVAARNGLAIAVAIWACARGGFVFVGLPTSLSASQWAYMLAHSRVAAALGQDELLPTLRAATSEAGLPSGLVGDADGELLRRRRRWDEDAPMPEPSAVYGVIYTSGTTGRPKAAQLAHLPSMQAAAFYSRTLQLDTDDRTAIHLPFYYVSGHITQLNPIMLAGGSAVAMPAFSPHALIETIRSRRVTFLDVVPAIWPLLLRDEQIRLPGMASLRVAAFGGAPMPVPIIDELRARLPRLRLFNVYGMSETAGVICCLPDHEMSRRPGSVGRPIPVADVRVMDEEGGEVGAGEPGELWVRGPTLTPGYAGDPAATAAAITDGWLHTGDIARVDDAGYVHVVDRKKDMINRGGVKIYPGEVEVALTRHPQVVEAAVFGVPDRVAGEIVAATVVPVAGGRVTEQIVRAWVRAQMAPHAAPRHVRVVATLPRNRTGKVDKVRLRDRLIADLGSQHGSGPD
jgi:acyl-CoA synthetase (AMP-forming)/AMP-acid ligase II